MNVNAETTETAEQENGPAQNSSPTLAGIRREDKFPFLSICGLAVTTGESWVVLGNSLTLAIYNGGAPAVLYAFVADSVCYWIVAASIAELASAMPSTATVCQWARITGGRYGHVTSWYAGWWSFAQWQVGVASVTSIMALQTTSMYATLHPEYEWKSWHIFCAYLACNWAVCLLILYGDRWLPLIESFGIPFTLGGWLISTIILAVMPTVHGNGYASTDAVWVDWHNRTGWSSDGLVFLFAMLNAAFAIGAPDIPCHLAEEMPNPKRNVPLAIFAKYVASFATGFLFLITLFYATPDLRAATAQHSVYPLANLYVQATSPAATVGLLVLTLLPTVICLTGAYAIAGRQGWGLARANATPFSKFFAHLHPRTKAPFRTIAFVGVSSTVLGCIYIGSVHAFNAIAGSFVVFSSLSYLAALIPHLLSGRRNVKPGTFAMPNPVGFVVNGFSCVYLLTFSVIFCFPDTLPVTLEKMNYTSVIISGWTALATLWWFVKRKDFDVVMISEGVDQNREEGEKVAPGAVKS